MENKKEKLFLKIKFKNKRLYALAIASFLTACIYISTLLEDPYRLLVILFTTLFLTNVLFKAGLEIQLNSKIRKSIGLLDSKSHTSIEELIRVFDEDNFIARHLPLLYVLIIVIIVQSIWYLDPFPDTIKHIFNAMSFLLIAIEIYRGTHAEEQNKLFMVALDLAISEVESNDK